MDKTEMMRVIDRLQRDFPRNPQILEACRLITEYMQSEKLTTYQYREPGHRRKYMREYMRQWRKSKKP